MCVVLAHAVPAIVRFPEPPWFVVLASRLAAEGMTLFFVLSGFVIYYNYAHTICTRNGLRGFAVARFARLYPLYFVVIGADLITEFGYDQLKWARLTALPYYATLTQSWLYRPIDDNALIYQFGPASQVSWSISTEFFFYIVFPAAAAATIAVTKSVVGRAIAAACFIAVAVVALTGIESLAPALENYGSAVFGPIAASQQDGIWRWLFYFSPYVRVFEFLLGCLAAAIYLALPPVLFPAEKRRGAWLTAGALLSIGVLHWSFFHRPTGGPVQLYLNFGFAPSMALLIFCCARYGTWFSRLMGARHVLVCGEASYSIYLLHMLVIHVLAVSMPVIVSRRIFPASMIALALAIASIIGLSIVTWTLIEVPARRWLRQALMPH
jgi:peptidoglycan/LPS O-acetylase OafA/YrhL